MVGVCPPKDMLGVDMQQSPGARGREVCKEEPRGVESLVCEVAQDCLLSGALDAWGRLELVCRLPPEKLM